MKGEADGHAVKPFDQSPSQTSSLRVEIFAVDDFGEPPKSS